MDEVILAAPSRRDLAQAVIREAQRNHLDVSVLPDLYGYEFHGRHLEQVDSGPLLRPLEEALLDALAEEVEGASDLGILFVRHDDRAIPARRDQPTARPHITRIG